MGIRVLFVASSGERMERKFLELAKLRKAVVNDQECGSRSAGLSFLLPALFLPCYTAFRNRLPKRHLARRGRRPSSLARR